MDLGTLPATTAQALQHRARFDSLRRRIFDELNEGSARWRLTWILPLHVLVISLLAVRGESTGRLVVQIVTTTIVGAMFVARVRSQNVLLKAYSFPIGILCYFVLLATTGGLASPLLIMGGLMMTGAAFGTMEPRWLRGAVFLMFVSGFVGLALFSRTDMGRLSAPLVGAAWPTAEYVTLSLVTAIFTMVGLHRTGCTMTRGYERVAFELAERREELCSAGEDRSRALEGMAARLAHEVKNPLAAIKGLSTHMARNAADPKTAERLAIVAAEADRLQAIVDGFLSFSRGLDDLRVGPTRPYEVAHELAVLLETRAQEAGVALEVAGDETLVLDADARKLRQALLNLVLNAVHASPRGATVHVAVTRVCEGARITVRDDGTGMSPEVLDRIRKPYFTTKEGGTGLGVAVARGLVEQHGGRIEYKSVPGTGTTVNILLPMKATPCARLPNPLRALDKADKPEPSPAGAR
jgi:signal transduction histidine kinase